MNAIDTAVAPLLILISSTMKDHTITIPCCRIYAPYMNLSTESVETASHDEYGE